MGLEAFLQAKLEDNKQFNYHYPIKMKVHQQNKGSTPTNTDHKNPFSLLCFLENENWKKVLGNASSDKLQI